MPFHVSLFLPSLPRLFFRIKEKKKKKEKKVYFSISCRKNKLAVIFNLLGSGSHTPFLGSCKLFLLRSFIPNNLDASCCYHVCFTCPNENIYCVPGWTSWATQVMSRILIGLQLTNFMVLICGSVIVLGFLPFLLLAWLGRQVVPFGKVQIIPYPLSSPGWLINSHDIQQINRRKSNCKTYARGIRISMKISEMGRMRYICHSGQAWGKAIHR